MSVHANHAGGGKDLEPGDDRMLGASNATGAADCEPAGAPGSTDCMMGDPGVVCRKRGSTLCSDPPCKEHLPDSPRRSADVNTGCNDRLCSPCTDKPWPDCTSSRCSPAPSSRIVLAAGSGLLAVSLLHLSQSSAQPGASSAGDLCLAVLLLRFSVYLGCALCALLLGSLCALHGTSRTVAPPDFTRARSAQSRGNAVHVLWNVLPHCHSLLVSRALVPKPVIRAPQTCQDLERTCLNTAENLPGNLHETIQLRRIVISHGMDKALKEVFDYSYRDYILSWYGDLSKDEGQLYHLLSDDFWELTRQLRNRLGHVDVVRVVCNDVVKDLLTHFCDLKAANTR